MVVSICSWIWQSVSGFHNCCLCPSQLRSKSTSTPVPERPSTNLALKMTLKLHNFWAHRVKHTLKCMSRLTAVISLQLLVVQHKAVPQDTTLSSLCSHLDGWAWHAWINKSQRGAGTNLHAEWKIGWKVSEYFTGTGSHTQEAPALSFPWKVSSSALRGSSHASPAGGQSVPWDTGGASVLIKKINFIGPSPNRASLKAKVLISGLAFCPTTGSDFFPVSKKHIPWFFIWVEGGKLPWWIASVRTASLRCFVTVGKASICTYPSFLPWKGFSQRVLPRDVC